MRDLLTHRAAATPAATAVVDATTGEARTYAALDDRVDRLAGDLSALGLAPGDHLGVLLETRPAFLRLVHAAMRLGCVLVPLDARLTPAELETQLERADVTRLVCGADTEETAREAAGAVPVVSIDREGIDGAGEGEGEGEGGEPGRGAPAAVEPAAWSFPDPQVIMFTSGTTGEPKAVVLTAGNLLASAAASAFRLGVLPDDRWHLCLPMYHMGGLAPAIRCALYGTAVVVQRGFEPDATRAAVEAHRSTGISLVPTMLRRLLDAGDLPASLRFVLLGGAPAPDELVERSYRRGVPVCPTYGMTETASQVATAWHAEAKEHVGTVGQPLVGTHVTIREPSGDRVPDGERGEVVVSGPTVSPGYYDGDGTGPFGPDGLHTGDLGYRDDAGRLWIENRLDDRIVTGGETVDPGEVVAALESFAGVAAAAVVGIDDEEWGERVAALVVPEGDGPLDRDALEAHCRERLAGYKLPRTVATASALPRTASDTVDRSAVRERLRDR